MPPTSPRASDVAGRYAGSRADLPDLLRAGFIGAVFLLVWVHLDPFHDLTSVANIEASEGGNPATQVAFSILGVAVAAVLRQIGVERLRPLATIALVLTGAWFAITIATSVSPAVSLRRGILLAITILASATVLLSARSVRQFANVTAGAALLVLAVCYVSLVVVPDLAMHTALDLREPEHAGSWRGVFSHKNEAGAVMVTFVFVGLFCRRVGNALLGLSLAIGAAIFLAFTFSKTAIALLPLVLIQTSLSGWLRGPIGRGLILLGPLAIILVVSLGSLFFPPVKDVVSSVLPDVSFTGRSEIWEFTAEHILRKPLTGWGYGAFWKTEATLYGGSETLSWVNQADQAHNGYLDIALFMGLPGLALSFVLFVVMPFRNLQHATRLGPPDATMLLFMRLWLFGLMSAAFESVFYDATNSLFFMFTLAIFGLRYLGVVGLPPQRDADRP